MHRRFTHLSKSPARAGAALLTAAFLAAAPSAQAEIRYVDATAPAGGLGWTWSSALKELDIALAMAAANPAIDQIWVAKGTYRPGLTGSAVRADTFNLVDGVTLYGGFPKFSHLTDPGFGERDPAAHTTILDGDIDLDGTPSGNVYTVVTAYDVTSSVDGFRVQGGNADGSVVGAFGAGGFSVGSSAVEIRSCEVRENAGTKAGGIHAYGSTLRVRDTDFVDNESGESGGGIAANTLAAGGTVTPMELCVERCRFIGNRVVQTGGAISVSGTDDQVGVHSSLFNGNGGGWAGGAISCWGEKSLGIAHCTFAHNEASTEGGAIYLHDDGTYELGNSILWDNDAPTDPEVHSEVDWVVDATSCCVMGLASTTLVAVDCFDLNPLFVDPRGPDSVSGNGDDDLSLRGDSPCINVGDPSYLSLAPCFTSAMDSDVDGAPRYFEPDLGAHEAAALGIVYCFGDGFSGACPCGNESAVGAGEGCLNSSGSGGTLAASGTTRLSEDDLELEARDLRPGQPALLFFGSTSLAGGGAPMFGDGLRCVGGGTVRLKVAVPDPMGRASYGPGLALDHEGVLPGDRRFFQVWFRDPSGPCGSGFNLTQGLELLFRS